MDPNNPEPPLRIGELLITDGRDLQEAYDLAQQSAGIDAQNGAAYAVAAIALHKMGESVTCRYTTATCAYGCCWRRWPSAMATASWREWPPEWPYVSGRARRTKCSQSRPRRRPLRRPTDTIPDILEADAPGGAGMSDNCEQTIERLQRELRQKQEQIDAIRRIGSALGSIGAGADGLDGVGQVFRGLDHPLRCR